MAFAKKPDTGLGRNKIGEGGEAIWQKHGRNLRSLMR